MDLHARHPPRLTTDRLDLRPLAKADGPAAIAALNDWQVTRWLTSVPYPYAADDFAWFLNVYLADQERLLWAIDGGAGLIGVIETGAELGYWLAPSSHGKGLMTEAACRVLDWQFGQGRDVLGSGYLVGNTASARVLAKLGFEPGKVTRLRRKADGAMLPLQKVSLTRARWDRLRSGAK